MVLSMPSTPGFIRSRFGLETNTGRFESPETKNVQRVLRAGSRWAASYTLPRMNRSQAAQWQAFLLSLEGGVNTFYGYDPDAAAIRGTATGTPLVNGAGQTGSSLVVDGLAAGTLYIFRAGDYFTVNNELKMVTVDTNTSGAGEATVTFKPALRLSPADNAPLTIVKASCEMILADDSQAMWEANQNHIYESITFNAIEVF